MCLETCECKSGGADFADAPQTLGSALRQFGRQITALKKQDKLAGQIECELAQNSTEHLWTVAHDPFGEGSEQARQWVEGLRHKLRHGEHERVVKTLSDLAQMGRELDIAGVLEREAAYFGAHRDHSQN